MSVHCPVLHEPPPPLLLHGNRGMRRDRNAQAGLLLRLAFRARSDLLFSAHA